MPPGPRAGRPEARRPLPSRPAARSPRAPRRRSPPRSRPFRTPRTTTRCRSGAAAGLRRRPPPRPRSCSLPGRRARGRTPARDALRHAEPERELLVVAGRPHRDGDRLAADPDLERLLDRDEVVRLAALRQPEHPHSRGAVRRNRPVHAASVLSRIPRPPPRAGECRARTSRPAHRPCGGSPRAVRAPSPRGAGSAPRNERRASAPGRPLRRP